MTKNAYERYGNLERTNGFPPSVRWHYENYLNGLKSVRRSSRDVIRYTFTAFNFGKIGLAGTDIMYFLNTGAGTVMPAVERLILDREVTERVELCNERYERLLNIDHPGTEILLYFLASYHNCGVDELPKYDVDHERRIFYATENLSEPRGPKIPLYERIGGLILPSITEQG